MHSILFVCLGNICRSPLAEGYAKYMIQKHNLKLQAYSAGLSRYHNGEPPCLVSQNLARKNGIDISSLCSQHISEFNLKSFDLIIAMDESNKQELLGMGLNGVKKLGEFGFSSKDVADLYYEPHRADEVWEMIRIGVSKIIDTLV